MAIWAAAIQAGATSNSTNATSEQQVIVGRIVGTKNDGLLNTKSGLYPGAAASSQIEDGGPGEKAQITEPLSNRKDHVT